MTVEKCAVKLKISKDDNRRLIGAIEHILYERLRLGHTAYSEHELLESARKLLGTEKRAYNAIKAGLAAKAICALVDDGDVLYQAVGPAYIEYSFEKRLTRIINEKKQKSIINISEFEAKKHVEEYNAKLFNDHGYALVGGQISAVVMALTKNCSIISGYGGTGKTTILHAVVNIAENLKRKAYLMALSGKAKERMRQATGRHAVTIHSFINAVKNRGDINQSHFDIDCNPLIIIDEASMVDVSLFNQLLKLFDNRCYSLLTVGDDAQLSPVGFGLAWHKMVNSIIPIVKLTEVHRHAAESSLYRIAMQIRKGESDVLPPWNGEKEGVYFVESDERLLRDEIVNIKMQLPKAQVLTPHQSERLPDSCIALNNELQAKINGEQEKSFIDSKPGFRVGRHFLHENDPVLVTENNYKVNLFNGTLGTLLHVDKNNKDDIVGEFKFEGHSSIVKLTISQCYELGLTLAYAITVHKSQGSEFTQTIISCVVKSNFVERSMIYTALTRTKRLCIIVGDQSVYRNAIASQNRSDTIKTGLKVTN